MGRAAGLVILAMGADGERAMTYMMEADGFFWDRSDAARIFLGRMIFYGAGLYFAGRLIERRAWSCSILMRAEALR